MRRRWLTSLFLIPACLFAEQTVQAPIDLGPANARVPEWQALTKINASYAVAVDVTFRAALAVKAGDYYYATMQFASENCTGRNIFRVPTRRKPPRELKTGELVKVGCVQRLFSVEDRLYVLHSDQGKFLLSELTGDELVPASLSQLNRRGAANLMFRYHQTLLAAKDPTPPRKLFDSALLSFPGARGQRYWLTPPRAETPWVLTEVTNGNADRPFSLTPFDPKQGDANHPFPSVIEGGDRIELAQDGRDNIYFIHVPKASEAQNPPPPSTIFRFSPTKGIDGTFGTPTPIHALDDVTPTEKLSLGIVRYLAAGKKGFVFAERYQNEDEDYRSVYYVDPDSRNTYRVPIEPTDVSGISIIDDCLLITRPNARRLVLYGMKDAECFRAAPQTDTETKNIQLAVPKQKEGKHVLD